MQAETLTPKTAIPSKEAETKSNQEDDDDKEPLLEQEEAKDQSLEDTEDNRQTDSDDDDDAVDDLSAPSTAKLDEALEMSEEGEISNKYFIK